MDMIKEFVVSNANNLWYILSPTKDVVELDKRAKPLLTARDDLIQEQREKIRLPTNGCNQFLKEVENMENRMNAIKEECKQYDTHQSLNIYSRFMLGKRIREAIEDINELGRHPIAKRFKGKDFVDAPQKVESQPSPKIHENSSSARTLLQICESIKDVNIQKIGIRGMGGIGKTTIMQSVNNLAEMNCMFDIIIWVTVSKEGNRRSVQNTIASRFGLNISKEPDDRVRYAIQKELERKKFLLLLDDVWQMIDLAEVGVPILNCENGCKVVLTTRDSQVCREMETDKDIIVEILSKDEAWHLFREKAGDVASELEIEPIAKNIVEECGGLPLVIIVAGSSLRKINDTIIWNNALRKISESNDIGERVFRPLKYSYDQLPTEGHRELLRYCALYPEDWVINLSELKEHCWVEGFVDEMGSIDIARDKAHCMIEELVGASLLERCMTHEENDSVKMHDVIRDLALKLSPKFFVGPSCGGGKKLERSEKMFLSVSELDPLPKNLNCLSLSTLFLTNQHDPLVLNIPESFFEKMPTLGVLDSSKTGIKSLPSSIQYLVNLRALFLDNCWNLQRLPSEVGALKRLEVLDLIGCIAMSHLPKEIGELGLLKCLRATLAGGYGCDVIPVGTIGRLLLLEELSIIILPLNRRGGVVWNEESMKLICKQELWKLSGCDPQVILRLPSRSSKINRQLTSGGVDAIATVVLNEALGRCEELLLFGDCFERKIPTLGLKKMADHLKYLSIVNCNEIQTLHNHYYEDDGDQDHQYKGNKPPALVLMLPNLESLQLELLPKWKCLWIGAPLLAPGSFSKLTTLTFDQCDSLKKAISWATIQLLPCLKDLSVSDCQSMEEIIVVGDEGDQEQGTMSSHYDHQHHDTDLLVIPQLKILGLENLPHLDSNGICRGALVKWLSLEELCIANCPTLRDLSITDSSSNPTNSQHHHHHDTTPILPKLKILRLLYLPELDGAGICRGDSVEWPSLEEIEITDCPKIKDLSFITHSSVPAPNLHTIRGAESWWSELNIRDRERQRLGKLFRRY